MSLQEKWANMLCGRDFTSDFFWPGFLFKSFGRAVFSGKKRSWRTSHQGIFLAAMFFLICFGRVLFQHFWVRMSVQKKVWWRMFLQKRMGFGGDFSSDF